MDREALLKELVIREAPTKIFFLVIDGLGGLPVNGKTELETASTPNMDRLAYEGACGLLHPVLPGLTPGSGAGHLSLFGYDPLKYDIGRGILEALGVGADVRKGDLTCRGNYATFENGVITDRRAGRIPTEVNRRLTAKLAQEIKEIDGVQVFLYPGMEHRFVVVFRGEGLSDDLTDADPQKNGLPPEKAKALSPNAKRAEEVVNKFIERATEILKDDHPANTVLLRGFSLPPDIPSMEELYGLRCASVAYYPMYRGLAQLLGMEPLEAGPEPEDAFNVVKENRDRYDFFYIHIKKTDSYGEDGAFDKKVEMIEKVDKALPVLLEAKPDVLVITGDHSTPSVLKAHSWHPVPILLWSLYVLPSKVSSFGESECLKGSLGIMRAVDLMPLVLANALRLKKYGA
ncbi:MAG: 2,3-bisphosphoglycerate-independent phosphoglycerate mutase [Synergistetes bacterium]|nr:MAG: putative 2,3-bisphosphoglycerate-independent phosphoglycerate mutase [bacterium 42_11]MBC7331730.1 2,3-bisphosphoglycerate-independent phosphoglycerate mutase [Synergistota bacterium]MDK2870747.1 2,3-bisphosphoglycerate-independent phosphoglycerate mutase [bacterium]